MSDLVRALFAIFDSEGSLQTAVAEHREESLYLEFKQKHDSSHPEIEGSDRKNFSKAVSAFANADGGVLIFGVATTRQPQGEPDRADALIPIKNAQAFAGRLADSILNTTQPPVDAVEFRVIESRAQPGTGYVACLVPASDTVPHRAVLADREYYRRTASGSRRLEHIDLEDMFGRRPRPVLEVELERRSAENGQDRVSILFFNEGRAIAKYSGAIGTLVGSGMRIAGIGGDVVDASMLNEGRPVFQFVERPGIVIHPSGIARAVGFVVVGGSAQDAPLSVLLRWYCDRMRWREQLVNLQPNSKQRLR